MMHQSLTLLIGLVVMPATMAQSSTLNDTTISLQSDTTSCPVFRQFDASNPNVFQHDAPNGCVCLEGLGGQKCGYCARSGGLPGPSPDKDAPCKTALGDDHVCRKGMLFAEEDTYKAYECRLFGTLDTFIPGGKISVYADIKAGTVDFSAYNRGTINDPHALDCHITGCTFQTGDSRISCEKTDCKCTDQCNSIVRNVVEDMLSGVPAEMSAEESEDGSDEHLVKIIMEGAPMDIEAMCVASACSKEAVATQDESLKDLPTEWKASATVSVIILGSLLAGFVLMILCFVVPACWCCCSRKSGEMEQLKDEYDTDSTTNINVDRNQGNTKSVLEFRNISRTVNLKGAAAKAHGQSTKVILKNISGSVEAGTLMGIMGPSGAGKSSLLNVLAAVDNGRARNSGQILLNGKVQKQGYRRRVAFVQQDDSLYSTLTVRECVEYSALLRLPNSMPVAQKKAAVWTTLEELRLTHISTNRIGSGGANAGVSGGERKRVSIGMELVAQPSVLFLDEPSSGLDAYAANQIMKVLSELAHRDRLVILSIHQPSMRSFLSMDQILLLGAGQVMYNGSPQEVGQFLERKGFPCPVVDTVADHMLEVVSHKKNHPVLTETRPRLKALVPDDGDNDFDDTRPEQRSLLNEFMVLFGRVSKDIFRNRELFLMQMCLSIVLALFVGGIFSDVTNDLAGFQNRMGAFYFSLSFFAFASFSSMDIFVKERHIFARETGSKYYTALTYFLSKTVLDMFVLRIVPVSVFVCIFYWLMGLKSDVQAFVVFWATLVLFNMCAGIMSICISIATPTVGQANLIAAVWFLIMLLFGGFLVNVQTMSAWYAWLRQLSIFYYSFEILMTNELSGLLLSFDAPGYPTIPIYGEVFLETIGMHADRQVTDLICLCALIIGFSLLAYILLLLTVPRSAGKHFQRMHSENARLPPEEATPEVKEETISRYNDDEPVAETTSMLNEGSQGNVNVTTSVLSAGSAATFWSCISPTSSASSQEREYEYDTRGLPPSPSRYPNTVVV